MFCCAPKTTDSTQEPDVVQRVADDPVFAKKDTVHGVRTTHDEPVTPEEALYTLKEGNARFVKGSTNHEATERAWREALSNHGQSPYATIIGCADSRCPVEIIFDAKPGDIFVLRNAGNTCTHSEGSMVGSVEYSVQHLRTKLILVLGHTKCGAIAGATKTMLANKDNASKDNTSKPCNTVLDVLLSDLVPVAAQAQDELAPNASMDEIANHAIKVNVLHTMERVLEYSATVRDMVRSGEVALQGAIYNLDTGAVEFLGRLPRQALHLGSHATLQSRQTDDLKAKIGWDAASTAASTEK